MRQAAGPGDRSRAKHPAAGRRLEEDEIRVDLRALGGVQSGHVNDHFRARQHVDAGVILGAGEDQSMGRRPLGEIRAIEFAARGAAESASVIAS